ncbi:arsenate reductase (glutaredoxin) [Pelistega europaea]|uniref:Arsenate reductase n=1 Tax=Pelistega europaea TaxID=106147 RepID=A0A7Y4P454_9BURK|nr:arsenate reductase (glutaredoxin) [Pelistega europaea]NOL49141.1 arsenate reductase (glutaredoxin) [Pelistega europaea]
MKQVTIYHNPRCSTSRNTLALIRESGIEPTVVEYLKHPLDKNGLKDILKKSGLTARELIRAKEELFKTLNLNAEGVTEEQLIDAMVEHPVLMNRPVVVTDKGARLCRPIETVKEIL